MIARLDHVRSQLLSRRGAAGLLFFVGPTSAYITAANAGVSPDSPISDCPDIQMRAAPQPSRVSLPSRTARRAPVAPGMLVGYPARESCAISANAIASFA